MEEDSDADPGNEEASIASVRLELEEKLAGSRIQFPEEYVENSLYAPQLFRPFTAGTQLGRTHSMEDFAVPSNIVYAAWHDPASSSRLSHLRISSSPALSNIVAHR